MGVFQQHLPYMKITLAVDAKAGVGVSSSEQVLYGRGAGMQAAQSQIKVLLRVADCECYDLIRATLGWGRDSERK